VVTPLGGQYVSEALLKLLRDKLGEFSELICVLSKKLFYK